MLRNKLLGALAPLTIALTAPIATAQEAPPHHPTQQQAAKQSGQQQGAAMQAALVELHAINHAETRLALAGINRGQNEDVRDLAKMLAKEHQENDRELMDQARKLGMDVAVTPQSEQAIEQMERQNQPLQERLQQAEGAQFDRAFVQAVVQSHQRALDQLRTRTRGVENQQVAKLVKERVKQLEDHLEEAQQLQRKLKASPAP